MDEGGWIQPPENTLDSLRQAILATDGIEFDLRMTADGELVIHHDRFVSVPEERLQGLPKETENWQLDDLLGLGFSSFEQILSDDKIAGAWRKQAKVGCVEIKRPHPKTKISGRFLDKKREIEYMGKVLAKAEQMLDEAEIPPANAVFYAFFPHMEKSIHKSTIKRPWSKLTPNLPPFGNNFIQKAYGAPSFILNSFSRLTKHHKAKGSPMMPCALEYLEGWHSYLPLGRKVGLKGKPLQRLTSSRNGFPAYVWPTKPHHEALLMSAGLTALIDDVDPNHTWLETGHARWLRPATKPMTAEQEQTLTSVSQENHLDLLREFERTITPWHELSRSEQSALLDGWRKRWAWSRNIDQLMADIPDDSSSMPWEVRRIIGHRGCGKSPRPVLT